jgi:hypothetical protein
MESSGLKTQKGVKLNNREKNRYEMFGKVWNFGDEEKNNFADTPTISALFGDIKMIHREIGLNETITKEGIRGKVVSKNVSQAEIIPIGLAVAGGIYGYAVNKSDSELIAFSDVNCRTFNKLRDSEIPGRIERILDKAEELGDALIPYGITADFRNEANTKLQDHLGKFASLNTGRGAKKTARETISLLFKQADKKLKVLDKLMLKYKSRNQALFSKYEAARIIYDKAGAHRLNNGTSVVTSSQATA